MRITFFAALLATALLPMASADHCTTWSTSRTTATFDVYHVTYVPCSNECSHTLALYEETNGIAGLQRGDDVVDDTCHGMIAPDRLIEMIGWG